MEEAEFANFLRQSLCLKVLSNERGRIWNRINRIPRKNCLSGKFPFATYFKWTASREEHETNSGWDSTVKNDKKRYSVGGTI